MNNITITDTDTGCNDTASIAFYVSLVFNVLLFGTTVASEALGASTQTDRNGILDALIKFRKSPS